MKKILNPIEFFNDKKLLITNLIIFVIGTVISVFMKAWFSSNFSVFFRTEINTYKTFTENTLSILLTAIVFLIAGKIINKKVRLIDCLNLSLFIRIPSYLITLTNILGTHSRNFPNINKDGSIILPSYSTLDIIILRSTSILNILIIIYFIILIYKSFKTIANAKKTSDYLILVTLLILSMILSSFLFKHI